MKALLLSIVIAVMISGNLNAQFTWTELNTGTTQTLTSSHATFISNAWACGYGGTVLRTTNSGVNWQSVGGNGIPVATQLINIVSFDATTALTAGYVGANTFVYKTSNGGANWTQVFTEAGFINAICAHNNLCLMMGDPVGGRWSLWKSTDQGTTWDSTGLYLPQAGGEAGWNNAMWNWNESVWFGTNNSRIYYSTNFGSSWAVQPTTGNLSSYAVWMHGLSGGQDGLVGGTVLQRSTNYGNNWATVTSAGAGNFGGITGGPNILTDRALIYSFYVRSSSVIYSSTNNGTNWTESYTAPNGTYRYIGTDRLGIKFYAVQTDGGISYLDIPLSVTQTSSEVPQSFSLEQNYPNPFNPSTKIRYNIYNAGRVSLKIFDSRGIQVDHIVNLTQQAGQYEVDWNASDLSSGTYFYQLTVHAPEGSQIFSDVKRMILVK